ncbi:MAG: hypothetical protein GVY30_02360 [Chloroflexi bacterium]|nr:hypothetical protein [Chloroflexota bacterium]
MKKFIALMLPWLVLGATLVAVVVLETLRTPDWRAELKAYVATQAVTGTLAVQSVAEAERPWHFEAAMGELMRQEWTTWGTVEEIPYPPQRVRCVLLAQRHPPPGAKTTARQIVYVAYHSDTLWHQGWLIHQGAREPFPSGVWKDLDTIGCELPLD